MPLARCPVCHGPTKEQTDRRGRYLVCLRSPDCRGKVALAGAALNQDDMQQKTMRLSPLLYLTGAALTGLCANPAIANSEGPNDLAETAANVAFATLAELKRRTEPA